MKNKINIGTIIMILVMAAGVFATIAVMLNGDVLDKYDKTIEAQQTIMNATLIIAAIPLAIAALLTILFPLGNMIMNPKGLVRFAIVLGAFGLVYFISYSLASNAIEPYMLQPDYETSETGSKLVGSMIYLIYIVGGVAVASILGASVFKLIKR